MTDLVTGGVAQETWVTATNLESDGRTLASLDQVPWQK
jgi:hypothetical protein